LRELLSILRCPCCGGEVLSATGGESYGRERAGGVPGGAGGPEPGIACDLCGRIYQVRKGIADFLVDPPPEVVREKEAFLTFWPGSLSTPEEWEEHRKTILAMPMLENRALPPADLETWRRHGREAFGICQGLDWEGRRVLELGAGRCWLAAHLARQGAAVVAVDILEDEVMGLGCGRFFEEEEGLRIHRVLCDMHRLPFRDHAFDAVVATATLHHSPDLPRLLREAGRVLKPGGLLLAANEPLYVPWSETPEEERRGAHEGAYTLWTWVRSLRGASFHLVEVRAAQGLAASLAFRAVRDRGPSVRAQGMFRGAARYGLLLALSPLWALRRKARAWVAGRPMRPLPREMLAYLRAALAGSGLEEEARADNPAHWGPGWHPPELPEGGERPFRWSGPRSLLLMPPARGAKSLLLELATFHPSPWSRPVEVEVRWRWKILGRASIGSHGWRPCRFAAPRGGVRGPLRLILVVRSGCYRPSELGMGGDSRLLGVACRAARWE